MLFQVQASGGGVPSFHSFLTASAYGYQMG